jgi:hypothetical protein
MNLFKKKTRYQLIRPKQIDFKDSTSQAIMKTVINGEEKKTVQDMEIICKDFKLEIPIILYNQNETRMMDAANPFIIHDGNLYGIYTFIQVEPNLVNIFVMYAGNPESSPICNKN